MLSKKRTAHVGQKQPALGTRRWPSPPEFQRSGDDRYLTAKRGCKINGILTRNRIGGLAGDLRPGAESRHALRALRDSGRAVYRTSQMTNTSASREIRLVHTSDLHVDNDRIAAMHGGDGAGGLKAVLATARALAADIVLLVGDTFDNHMVDAATIDRAGRALADAGLPIVILPGNHDPATSDSIWLRGRFDEIQTVVILGITNDRIVAFRDHGIEFWGNAHRDYHDMVPLADPPPRGALRWQVALGHGHYEPPESWANPLRPSWLISDAMIAATGADYVALGHWDRAAQVGDGAVPAYYSGAPHHAGTANLVRLTRNGEVIVTREGLQWPV
jgi:Calcineurin-like phosphoesterase